MAIRDNRAVFQPDNNTLSVAGKAGALHLLKTLNQI